MTLTRRRFLSGIRGIETTIYEAGLYPFGYIGPVFVIWRATTTASRDSQPAENTLKPTGKRKRKQAKKSSGEETIVKLLGLIEEMLESLPDSPDDETRTIWIRCHPAIFSTVLSTLKNAASLSLDSLKKSPGYSQNSYFIEVIDLRDSINVFEITGSKSSQVIRGALTPTIANHTGEFKKVKHIGLSPQSDYLSVYSSSGHRYPTSKALALSQAT